MADGFAYYAGSGNRLAVPVALGFQNAMGGWFFGISAQWRETRGFRLSPE
jgi:hypothetical protein